MPQAAREAALKAATLNPHLAGVDSILRASGYVFDQDLDRWVSYDESMRRKGMVQVDGEWMSRRELAQRQLQEQSLLLQSQAAQATEDANEANLLAGAGASPYGVDYSNGYNNLLLGAGYGSVGFGRHGFRPFFSTRSMRSMRPHIPAAVPVPRGSVHSAGRTVR